MVRYASKHCVGRYRTGTFFSNGRQLTWEYPRHTPHGDQVDLVEMMDIANGLIVHHRVYWGWVGFRSLLATDHQP
jgi:steroid Delta-isomerase